MDVLTRHRVTVSGREGATPIFFAPGYGLYKQAWRLIEPALEADHRTVLFDIIGVDQGTIDGYPADRYGTLQGHADDVVHIADALGMRGATLVGHSVGAMIGILANLQTPGLFDRMVLIGASPRYIDDDATGYRGGFSRSDVDGLLDAIESNYLGWTNATAPSIMANPDRPELTTELIENFSKTNPRIALQYARAVFLSDHRADIERIDVPTLVVQCAADVMVPQGVGDYLHEHIRDSKFALLRDATGHFPFLSAPESTLAVMRDFITT